MRRTKKVEKKERERGGKRVLDGSKSLKGEIQRNTNLVRDEEEARRQNCNGTKTKGKWAAEDAWGTGTQKSSREGSKLN